MRKPLPGVLLAALVLSACTVSPAPRWRLTVSTPDGRTVGTLLVAATDEPASGACLGRTTMKNARVLAKEGFAHDPVGENVGLDVRDGRFFAELSLGICDASLALEGPLDGSRARGTARRTTIAGPQPAGTFVAERAP